MSDRNDRKVVAFVDLEALRAALEAGGTNVVQFAGKLAGLARGQGRLLHAALYGDLSTDDVRELRRLGCEGRVTTEDGEGSAPESISLALDAAELLGSAPAPDVVIVATDDAQLAELVRRWRRRGAYVVALVPQALVAQEPAKSADRAMSVEQLLSEAAVELAEERPPREIRPRPAAPVDLGAFDWSKLVLLLRDLEAKMPFVGMRWLKNKVLGPHNVGVGGVAEKQALLNRAVEEGLLETYRVGNRDEQGEPVTACRLLRENERVKAILAANPGPPPVSAPADSAG